MKYNLKKHYVHGQETWIQTYGDRVFEQLCDCVPEPEFTCTQVLERITLLQAFTPKARGKYLRLVLHNVALAPCPPLTQLGRLWIWTGG